MRLHASASDGTLKMGDKVLPGIVQDVRVEGALAVDSKRRPKRSGTSKQPKGFDDMEVKIQVVLPRTELGNDPYDDLAVIIGSFFGLDKGRRPAVHRIHNKLCRAAGIRRVIYSTFEARDALAKTDLIRVTITLTQYRPIPKLRKAAKMKKVPPVKAFGSLTEFADTLLAATLSVEAASPTPQLVQVAQNPPLPPPAPEPRTGPHIPSGNYFNQVSAADERSTAKPSNPATTHDDPLVLD